MNKKIYCILLTAFILNCGKADFESQNSTYNTLDKTDPITLPPNLTSGDCLNHGIDIPEGYGIIACASHDEFIHPYPDFLVDYPDPAMADDLIAMIRTIPGDVYEVPGQKIEIPWWYLTLPGWPEEMDHLYRFDFSESEIPGIDLLDDYSNVDLQLTWVDWFFGNDALNAVAELARTSELTPFSRRLVGTDNPNLTQHLAPYDEGTILLLLSPLP